MSEPSRPFARPARRAAWRPVVLALGWLLAWPALATEAARDPGEFFFDTTFGDFSEELQNAREQGKTGVLLMFEMDECPFCHRMKTTVLNRPEVQAFYKEHFLIFPVDIEGDVDVTDFAGQAATQKDFALKQYRVRATPVFAFFDLDGQLVARYTGATRDAQEFMQLGEYVLAGAYKDMPFTQYKRKAAAAPASAAPPQAQ